MGDRALIIFHDAKRTAYSPVVYLHWNGGEVGQYLEAIKQRMGDRKNDVDYAAARFVGLAHEAIAGALSLGIFEKAADFKDEARYLKKISHGDAGVFLVDCNSWGVRCYGGYGLTQQEAAA